MSVRKKFNFDTINTFQHSFLPREKYLYENVRDKLSSWKALGTDLVTL